jgi:hypothetical protein
MREAPNSESVDPQIKERYKELKVDCNSEIESAQTFLSLTINECPRPSFFSLSLSCGRGLFKL